MKRIIFSLKVFLFGCLLASAQTNHIHVTNPGIIIGHGNPIPNNNVSIVNNGSNPTAAYVVQNTSLWSGNYLPAFFAIHQRVGINKDIAVRAAAVASSPLSRARSYGVYAVAGNATSGYNYSLFAELYGTTWGTALFAASAANTSQYIPGRYAGFFNGRVFMSERLGIGWTSPAFTLDVNGTIWCRQLLQGSDARFKTNVAGLESSSGRIGQLRPVTYNSISDDLFMQKELLNRSSSASSDTARIAVDLQSYFAMEERQDGNRRRIGFIAQEFKEVFPELVFEDEMGRLSIDYISLIPVLVETIQDMSGTIQMLNRRLEAIENSRPAENRREFSGIGNFDPIGSNENAPEFTIFPNPNHGTFSISLSSIEEREVNRITITDSRGNLVYSTNSFREQIQIPNPITGLYIISLNVNNTVLTQRFSIL